MIHLPKQILLWKEIKISNRRQPLPVLPPSPPQDSGAGFNIIINFQKTYLDLD